MQCQKRETLNLALKNFSKALESDDSDVLLWHDFGVVAFRGRKYRLARYAFERAIAVQINHWPSVVKLCEVLFILGVSYIAHVSTD